MYGSLSPLEPGGPGWLKEASGKRAQERRSINLSIMVGKSENLNTTGTSGKKGDPSI